MMSKGIGSGYVNRMKRFHVPRISNPRERVSVVCDRAFYHNGAFKYKLPRFFRDRFYRMKFPCDAKVWNKKKMCYENKIVWRYKSKNLLALQIQNEVRSRVLEGFGRRVEEKRLCCPHLSDDQIYLEVTRDEQTSRLARQKDIFTKMSRFYNACRFKQRKF